MRRKFGVWCRLAIGLSAVFAITQAEAQKAPVPGGVAAGVEAAFRPAPAGTPIACRVLEAHTSDRDQMTVVVFHQRDAGGRAPLGELIRQHDGARVRFETADAKPHSATLFRLKSCFGRGLLLFPASSAHLTPGAEFALQVGAQ